MKPNLAALAAFAKGDMDNFLTAATPGGIEAQEKAGQTTFVANATMPGPKHLLEKLGIKVGEPIDNLFYSVTMPEGWKKVATEHSMWSDLLDNKGRKRASIFYKAAFYDRNAHMNLHQRYTVSAHNPVNESGEPAEYGKHTHFAIVVKDAEREIHRLGLCTERDYAAKDKLVAQGEAWLDEKYPQWKDDAAYWD